MYRHVILLTAACVALHGQSLENFSTLAMMNGRVWTGLDEPRKVFYMTGLRDQLISVALESGQSDKYLDEKWAKGFVVGDYVRELDLLYKDRENIRIPIPWAFTECTAKLKGATSKHELERRLISLRTFVSDLR